MTGEPQMARTLAELPQGSRITDYLSLGVMAKTFPVATSAKFYLPANIASLW